MYVSHWIAAEYLPITFNLNALYYAFLIFIFGVLARD